MAKKGEARELVTLKCSVCNEDCNYIDYWNGNKFCSTECQEKYYNWMKKNKESIA